jgi:hypothetical protein
VSDAVEAFVVRVRLDRSTPDDVTGLEFDLTTAIESVFEDAGYEALDVAIMDWRSES